MFLRQMAPAICNEQAFGLRVGLRPPEQIPIILGKEQNQNPISWTTILKMKSPNFQQNSKKGQILTLEKS